MPHQSQTLQQKTIDGQENPVNVAFAFKLQETQKYFSMTKRMLGHRKNISGFPKFECGCIDLILTVDRFCCNNMICC